MGEKGVDAMAELIAQLDQSAGSRSQPRGRRGPAPQASPLRRRVPADQAPLTVAEPVAQGGTFNVLVLLDQPGRAQEAIDTVLDRIGPQLGRLVVCYPMGAGTRWAEVGMTTDRLEALVEGTPVGARVAFGRRDETVAVEACEGGYRMVVDLSEDDELRRTLKMCAIAYVVGPQGVNRFADEIARRPRLLTPPRDADRSAWAASL